MSTQANKELIEKVNKAFTQGPEQLLQYFSDDVKWTMIGMPTWEGKESVRESMKNDEYSGPPDFSIESVIAEGDKVVCEGAITMTKKTGEQSKGRYCDVYTIKNGKVSELRSYFVEIK